jgi:hypothetical protein
MFAIQLIHKAGGSKSVSDITIADCKDAARKMSEAFPSSYIAATIPYAVYKVRGCENTYDTTIPFEIQQGLGMALRFLYKDTSGGSCIEDCPPDEEDNAL